jgi:outer membrane protein insertion porin family
MRSLQPRLLLSALLLLSIQPFLFAQSTFRLQNVRVVGSRRFKEGDLIDALGLKTGTMVDLDMLKKAADHLMATGVLSSLEYKYTPLSTGLQVEYTVTDGADFLPCRYDNIVWIEADELTRAVHEKVSLYDGSAPTTGELLDQISLAISEVLEKSGVVTQVRYELHTRGVGNPVDGISFVSDTIKPKIQEITLVGATLMTPAEKVESIKRLISDEYNATSVHDSLTDGLFFLYGNKGYLRVAVGEHQAKIVGDPQQGMVALTVPVDEGAQYRWQSIQWTGNNAIATPELEKMVPVKPGTIVDHGAFDAALGKVHGDYKSKGYLAVKMQRTPHFNDQGHTVTYAIAVNEGDQFRMGTLQITGLDPVVITELQKKWKLQPGDPFDGSYLSTFLHDNSALINGHGRSKTLKSLQAPTPDKKVNVTLQF